MFGFGFGEILLLAAIGLIVLGPKQLPQVARVIGRTIGELKKALHDVTAQVAINLDEENKPKRNPNQHNASASTEGGFQPTPATPVNILMEPLPQTPAENIAVAASSSAEVQTPSVTAADQPEGAPNPAKKESS